MAVPGPPAALWAVALVLWAFESAVLGEAVRRIAIRGIPSWRTPEPVERFLLDFFLGGASLYLVAAIPIGAFVAPVVFGVPLVAGVSLAADAVARRSRGAPVDRTGPMASGGALIAGIAAVGLYVVELAPALAAGTGNTFDSSLLSTYTALLLQHGHLPISLQPYGTTMVLYPQGTTVWLAWAQLDFGLPAARTSLLVTPLFLALVPLAGYVFGRRQFGSDRAGAAVAVAFAVLGPATRSLVGGSNDLAVAFPLVVLLSAQAGPWSSTSVPSWGDALGFGLLAGYSAALNPVGAEWLFPALLGLGAAAGWGGAAARWLARWAASVGAALVPIVPTLYVLALGWRSPGFVPGGFAAPAPSPPGITTSQLIGSVDPFLFRAGDVELSPIPALRAELALLLVLGAAILWIVRPRRVGEVRFDRFAHWVVAGGLSIAGWLLVLRAAHAGWAVAGALANLTSAAELSTWLFTVYGLVAAVPLVFLVEQLARPAEPGPTIARAAARFRRARTSARTGRGPVGLVPLAAAVAIVAPGIVLTPAQLPPVLGSLYTDFGTVSPADFALLACAGAHLPSGSRVLVAPGSAAEFLPGYARGISLVYPMEPGWPWANASYRLVLSQLTNGTLSPAGTRALAALDVGYIAVTEANSVLWPALSPAPLLNDSAAYPVLFHQQDAYLFGTHGPAAPFSGCD